MSSNDEESQSGVNDENHERGKIDEVENILGNVVSTRSRYVYTCKNVIFMIWVYNNPDLKQRLLAPSVLESFEKAENEFEGKQLKKMMNNIAKKSLEATN